MDMEKLTGMTGAANRLEEFLTMKIHMGEQLTGITGTAFQKTLSGFTGTPWQNPKNGTDAGWLYDKM